MTIPKLFFENIFKIYFFIFSRKYDLFSKIILKTFFILFLNIILVIENLVG